MPNDFTNQRVLITGGSSGIGAELARQFHDSGADVLLLARREERLKAITSELNAKRKSSADYVVVDLASAVRNVHSETFHLVKQAIAKFDPTIVVNNAGRGSFGYFESIPVEEELEMVRLNVEAYLLITSLVLPRLKQKGGSLVYVSSIAALQPLPFMATYGATKAFELSFADALREEVRPFGVKVHLVCPGPVDTEFGGVARVPGELTGVSRDSSSRVAGEILSLVERGQRRVYPGFQGKLLRALLLFPIGYLKHALVHRVLYRTLRKAQNGIVKSESQNDSFKVD